MFLEKKPTSNLIGKGGLGLVMYYLATKGIEFSVTSDRSDHGDIWVSTDDRILKCEIKTSAGKGWLIRLSQMRKMDVYFLVQLTDARCWALSVASIAVLIDGRIDAVGNARLSIKDLGQVAESDWSSVGAAARASPIVAPGRPPKVVRRMLASGEIKEYSYAR